jgi:hypothetical protein
MINNSETVGQVAVTGSPQGGFLMEKADHAMGVELQIVELVEQQTRALVQHREDDAELLEPEIVQLRSELAAIVDAEPLSL